MDRSRLMNLNRFCHNSAKLCYLYWNITKKSENRQENVSFTEFKIFQFCFGDIDIRALPRRKFFFQTEANWVAQFQCYKTLLSSTVIFYLINATLEQNKLKVVWEHCISRFFCKQSKSFTHMEIYWIWLSWFEKDAFDWIV